MERQRERRRERAESDADPVPAGRQFSDQEVGRIIAAATELQAKKQSAEASPRAIGEQDLQQLAAQFGIDRDCLQKAIELTGSTARCMVLAGDIPTVRKVVLSYFSKVDMTSRENRMVTIRPKLLYDGENGVEVRWGDSRLVIAMSPAGAGSTKVEWEPVLGETAKRQTRFVRVLLGSVLSLTAGSFLAVTGSLALVGLGIAGVATAFGLGTRNIERRPEEEFAAFCDTELRNLQVLDASGGISALP